MWDGMANCIRRSAKEVLGFSRGGGGRSGAWWWSEEVREKVTEKQKAYAALSNCTSEEEKGERERLHTRLQKSSRRRLSL